MTNKLLLFFTLPFFTVMAISCTKKNLGDEITVYCNQDNDLYQMLVSNDITCKRYEDVGNALMHCDANGTLLVLAKNYPNKKTVLPKGFYTKVKEKNIKVFVEFPDSLPSGKTGEIGSTTKERIVIVSNFLGREDSLDIIDAGLYSYVSVTNRKSYLKGAKVAGFHKAVYGLDDTLNFPILYEDSGVLVSTTKLSDFVKSRYSPYENCKNMLAGVISLISIDMEKDDIKWEPLVKSTYRQDESLASDAYQNSVEQGAAWYEKARFLIHPDWKDYWKRIEIRPLPVGSPMDLSLPSGDGSLGIMEGHYSWINPDGSQDYRYWLRADCVAESAMTFAIANNINENIQYKGIATNLMNFLYDTETFMTASSRNPTKSSYGLLGWADTHTDRYYGDDNARVILGSIMASKAMETNAWDRKITELILANFRTSGKNGFRSNALMEEKINHTTWQALMKKDLVNIAPHYESWLWATYLWLYDKTGYRPLLNKAKTAIQITMENYPGNWLWTNGLQQERARMILPLSWLVRIEDTPQHKAWLVKICNDLLKNQVECGAIREELGEVSTGKYGAPKTNMAYGTTEAPVIQTNGDPVADMLYTSNFAFFALNEAAQATQDQKYLTAVDKLADFLVRIQTTSSGRADLDGCWFRAFDYENWEYYGSNADHGWGAWGTLTGWTQSFITTTLALKLQNTSYWEVTKDSKIGSDIEAVWSQMLPGVEH